MPLLVTDLAERPMTDVTIVGLESSMLSKVVSEIARFFEHLVASLVQALENEVFPQGSRISILDHFVPLVGDSFEVLLWYDVVHEAVVLAKIYIHI